MSRAHRLLRLLKEQVPVYGALVGLTLFIVVPFLWLLTSTVRPVAELYVYPPRWIPQTFTLVAYQKAFQTFARPLLNSAGYGLVTAILTLVVACPAAYSLTRLNYPGKRSVTGVFLITQMLPFVLLLLPDRKSVV